MFDMLSGTGGLFIGATLVVGLALYVWYLFALSQLFPKLGLPSNLGWIPVVNDWKLMTQAGVPGWLALCSLVPPIWFVALIARTIAMYRIGQRTDAGPGLTVIGFLLPPLWASMTVVRFDRTYAPAHHSDSSWTPGTASGVAPAVTPGEYDPFRDLISGFTPSNAQTRASADQAAGLAPAPQLFDTEAHVLPPITAESLAQALGQPVSEPKESLGGVHPELSETTNGAVSASPLSGSIEAEYERLARESFQAPPALPFGDTVPQPRFSWDAAVQQPAASATQPPVPEVPSVEEPQYLVPQRQPVTRAIPLPVLPPEPEPATDSQETGHTYAVPPIHPVGLTQTSGESVEPPILSEPDANVLNPAVAEFLSSEPDEATFQVGAGSESSDVDHSLHGETSPLDSPTSFQWVLEFEDGSVVQLHPDTLVGRAPQSAGTAVAVTVADSTRTLSKTHARFTHVGRLWLVEDLGSTNGVRLMNSDGTETLLVPHEPARATSHMWLGTLRVTLRSGLA